MPSRTASRSLSCQCVVAGEWRSRPDAVPWVGVEDVLEAITQVTVRRPQGLVPHIETAHLVVQEGLETELVLS